MQIHASKTTVRIEQSRAIVDLMGYHPSSAIYGAFRSDGCPNSHPKEMTHHVQDHRRKCH